MSKKILFLTISVTSLLILCLSACQEQPKAPENILRVGTISGPETELMEVAKDIAQQQYSLKLQIVPFKDYNLPNSALADGSIDANVFQHQPYLNQTLARKHYKLISIGKTFVYPMGLYSKTLKDLKELPDKAIITIPDDPSNRARALILLAKANVINLNPNVGTHARIQDIISNPKKVKIKELNPAQLSSSLDKLATVAAINTNYAIPAGLMPSTDALAMEDPDSVYANIVVVRASDKDDLRFKQLLKALHSKEVQSKTDEIFKGQAIPAWDH